MQQKFVNVKQKLRLRNRVYIYNYLKDNCCSVCGEDRIACLQFHHTNPNDKSFEPWMSWGRDFSMKKLKEEISKCQVLCANCHAVETATQQWRYSFITEPIDNESTRISSSV